ncbi:hypothetical protein K458DRAFT_100210 [Lentithecium fluviatile CBS 122367]|uniref:Uncharacterized protein n=1 Tax=Lentithecium fluviatile CBS 122367 TaxID=1168545 RepID=A0A6G1JID7_9PLEO|nr:hypothetical protein K458DRAFT_100210 [Lentithecium fluviatile CBS 122367]
MISSIDDAEASGEDDESFSDDSSPSHAGEQTPNAASTRLHLPLPASEFQLPLRPAPSGREGAGRSTPRGTFSEDLPSSPPKHPFRSSRFGQERTNSSEDGNEGASQARIHAATDGQAEETETIQATPTRNRARSLRQHSSFNPSPLQQAHTMSSPRQGGGSADPDSNGADEEHPERADSTRPQVVEDSPTRFLRGYFDQRQGYYSFVETIPQTEPRPRSRSTLRARTMSTSSDPTHAIQVQRPDPGTSEEDVFYTPLAPDPPPRTAHGPYGTAGSYNNRYWSPLGSDLTNRLNAWRQMSQR